MKTTAIGGPIAVVFIGLWTSLSEDGFEILFRCGDGHEVEFVVQHLEYRRGQEGRSRRADADVAHTQEEQGEKNADGFLLVPGEDQRQRQPIDVGLESIGKRQSNADRGVGIVALSNIQ